MALEKAARSVNLVPHICQAVLAGHRHWLEAQYMAAIKLGFRCCQPLLAIIIAQPLLRARRHG